MRLITVDKPPPTLEDLIADLTKEVRKQNILLGEWHENQRSFRKRFAAGVWTGLGTVVGATVMVSLVVLVLRPLGNINWISPIVNRVIDDLETRQPAARPKN
ncbi:MAG TPA: DUF5665 domain-containing protein [Fimbriimonas sp.]|nr:DUF5665 domain-containing protein [Fimbriimonas sp.]